jgi:hypothetical protein
MNAWLKAKILRKKLAKVEREYKSFQQTDKYKKLNADEKQERNSAHLDIDCLPLWEDIQELETNELLKKLRHHKVPYINRWNKEGKKYWEEGQSGTHYLNTEGFHKFRNLLREEQKAKRDMVLGWIPLITALTGLLGIFASIITIIKYWKR